MTSQHDRHAPACNPAIGLATERESSSESPKRHYFAGTCGCERFSEQIRISFALSWILSHSFTQKNFFFVNLTSPTYADAILTPSVR